MSNDNIFAAASTTGPGSSERIANEFISAGQPAPVQSYVPEGGVMGGFEIKTPKVGDGFIEWALNGYDAGHDLDGRTKTNPGTDCYDKHGDWMFDKTQVTVPAPASTKAVNDDAYSKKER